MSLEYSTVVEGSVLSLPPDPRVRLMYVTDEHNGPARTKIPDAPPPAVHPKSLGDERHQQLLGAIKGLSGIKVSQDVQQNATVQQGLAEAREWRHG